MKKNIVYIFTTLMLIVATATTSSCSNEDYESIQDSSTDTLHVDSISVFSHQCLPVSFVHHRGVEAQAFECGNIEYWECSTCGIRYKDALGQDTLKGSPILLSKAIILARDSSDVFTQKAKTRGLAFDILNIALAIGGVVNSCVAGGMSVNSAKVLQQQLDSLNNELAEAQVSLNALQEKAKDLIDKMTNIPSEANKITSILRAMKHRLDDMAVLKDYTKDVYDQVVKLEADSLNDYTDSISDLLTWWGNDKECINKTLKLFNTFIHPLSTYADKNMTGVWEDYMATCKPLVCDGWQYRRNQMGLDMITMAESYYLAMKYYEKVFKPDHKAERMAYEERITKLWDNYIGCISTSDSIMKICKENEIQGVNYNYITYNYDKNLEYWKDNMGKTIVGNFKSPSSHNNNNSDYNPNAKLFTTAADFDALMKPYSYLRQSNAQDKKIYDYLYAYYDKSNGNDSFLKVMTENDVFKAPDKLPNGAICVIDNTNGFSTTTTTVDKQQSEYYVETTTNTTYSNFIYQYVRREEWGFLGNLNFRVMRIYESADLSYKIYPSGIITLGSVKNKLYDAYGVDRDYYNPNCQTGNISKQYNSQSYFYTPVRLD